MRISICICKNGTAIRGQPSDAPKARLRPKALHTAARRAIIAGGFIRIAEAAVIRSAPLARKG